MYVLLAPEIEVCAQGRKVVVTAPSVGAPQTNDIGKERKNTSWADEVESASEKGTQEFATPIPNG